MKSKILNMLKQHENTYLSGAEISETLNISRQAVSKHIGSLKAQGYQIDSVSRKGHRYISSGEKYNKAEILSELKTEKLGHHMFFLDTVGSTNDYLKAIAFKSDDLSVVIAEEQSSGKGRLGRQWDSQKGAGIWLSILLKPDIEPAEAPKITQIAAAAMTLAIEKVTHQEIGIKWPNDLILQKKKLCGILTEMSAELGGVNYVVVGIGVNVNQTEFKELDEKAISLKMVLGSDVSRKTIVTEFLSYFEDLYDDFIEKKTIAKTMLTCRSHSVLLNKEARVITKSSERKVKIINIDDDGQLIVINEKDIEEKLFYGEISVRGLYDYVD